MKQNLVEKYAEKSQNFEIFFWDQAGPSPLIIGYTIR